MSKSKRKGNRRRRVNEIRAGKFGTVCAVCNERIDLSLPCTDDKSMSADHIWPRYLGGTWRVGNVQPTHRHCNNDRSVDWDKENTYCRTFYKRFLTFALGDCGGLGRALIKRVTVVRGTIQNPYRSKRLVNL